jgi:hypothetical protein
MLYLTQHLALPVRLQLSLCLTIGLITLGLLIFVACQRYGALANLVQGLGRLRVGQKRLQQLSQYLAPLDAQLSAWRRFTG